MGGGSHAEQGLPARVRNHRLLGNFLLCFILRNTWLLGYVHIGVGSAVQLPFPWGARRGGVRACKLFPSVLANRLHCLSFSVPFRLVLLCFSVTQQALFSADAGAFPGRRNPQLLGLCHDVPATSERDAPGGAAAHRWCAAAAGN